MITYIRRLVLIMLIMILSVCSSPSSQNAEDTSSDDIAGKILIWHPWTGTEREALRGVLDDFMDLFMDLYPSVTLVEETYPYINLGPAFDTQVEAGLSPDLLIAPSHWAKILAQDEYLYKIDDDELDLSIYLSAAIAVLRQQDHVYGLPLSLDTLALYYNKPLLAGNQPNLEQSQAAAEQFAPETSLQPARDLDTLLCQAHQNKIVATFTAITAGLSVGIGFGLQTISSNFISGILLLFEGAISF